MLSSGGPEAMVVSIVPCANRDAGNLLARGRAYRQFWGCGSEPETSTGDASLDGFVEAARPVRPAR